MTKKKTMPKKEAEYTLPVLLSNVYDAFVIFENRIRRIGSMNAQEFHRFVIVSAIHEKTVEMILTPKSQEAVNINRFDRFERWYCLLELVKLRRIAVYQTGEEAQQAWKRLQKSQEAIAS